MFRRDETGLAQLAAREEVVAWEEALVAEGLPFVGLGGPRRRPRLQLAAALPAGMAAERELADLFLAERRTVDVVRAAVVRALPAGASLVDLFDVWVGSPALPAQAVAADYRVTLAGDDGPLASELAMAARRLLAREAIPRDRPKGAGQRRYDLRPLLADVRVLEPGPPIVIGIRTRLDPQLGTGRPEEVLAALGDVLGRPIQAARTRRERVILAGEP